MRCGLAQSIFTVHMRGPADSWMGSEGLVWVHLHLHTCSHHTPLCGTRYCEYCVRCGVFGVRTVWQASWPALGATAWCTYLTWARASRWSTRCTTTPCPSPPWPSREPHSPSGNTLLRAERQRACMPDLCCCGHWYSSLSLLELFASNLFLNTHPPPLLRPPHVNTRSPSGLVSASGDRKLIFWDITNQEDCTVLARATVTLPAAPQSVTGATPAGAPTSHTPRRSPALVYDLAPSADGTCVVAATHGGLLRVYNVGDGSPVALAQVVPTGACMRSLACPPSQVLSDSHHWLIAAERPHIAAAKRSVRMTTLSAHSYTECVQTKNANLAFPAGTEVVRVTLDESGTVAFCACSDGQLVVAAVPEAGGNGAAQVLARGTGHAELATSLLPLGTGQGLVSVGADGGWVDCDAAES